MTRRDGDIDIKDSNVSGQIAIGDDNEQTFVGTSAAGTGDDSGGGLLWVAIGTVAGVVAAIAAVIALFLM
jgi:hypothetical protein